MVQPEVKNLSDKMRILRQRYVEHLEERVHWLQQIQQLWTTGEPSGELLQELKAEAHKLAGTGATYGFAAVSQTGKQLELLLMDSDSSEQGHLQPALAGLIDACSSALVADGPNADSPATDKVMDNPASIQRLPKVLIVDDDHNMQQLLVDLLSEEGQILLADTIVKGMAVTNRDKPDLILLDRNLAEGESGLQMLDALQADAVLKDIPVIMITSNDQPEEVIQALMAGAADYITKPFAPADVAGKVRSRLQHVNTHILIADDDASIREILAHKFQGIGCRVTCVEDGGAAWEVLQTQHFSLAILDRMMPGFDGVTLLRKMKAAPKTADIPVVFLTARHYGADVIEGFNTGAADYVTKPFNSDELMLRVMRLIRTPKS